MKMTMVNSILADVWSQSEHHWDIIKHLSNVSLSPFSKYSRKTTEHKLSYVWFNMRLLLVVLNFRSCVYCIRVRSPFLRG